MLPTLLLLAAAVAVGAMAQRSTGTGFSLVVAPACAIAVLPEASIGTLVRLSLLADLVVLLDERASIEWRSVRQLLVPAALAVPVALVAGAMVPDPTMRTATSVVTLAAAGAMAVGVVRRTVATGPSVGSSPVERTEPLGAESVAPAASSRVAGFAAGFMGVTTGMPGPPLALHASRSTRPLANDRASMVVLFLVIDLVATLAHPRSLPAAQLGLLGVAVVVGIGGGAWLSGRVRDQHLRAGLVVIVVLGACAGVVHVLS